MYKNKKIFVLGMAKSGYEVAKLLSNDNIVFITDIKKQEDNEINKLNKLGVNFILSDKPELLLDSSFDILVKNPGIKYNHPCVLKAKQLNIPVINEIEVAYHYLDKSVKIIAVTGSNGKTTTTTIIYKIMKKAFGNRVHLAGNIGIPLSQIVKNIKKDDFLIMEISDHQLCDMYDYKANVSIITNIFDCHSDFHDGHYKYLLAKSKIFNNQTLSDVTIINRDNYESSNLATNKNIRKLYFSKYEKSDCYYSEGYLYYKNKKFISTTKIKIKGMHNYENIMCAILATKIYGVEDYVIRDVICSFKGVEHRLEFVDNINGINFYNDSKSTNVESTKIALDSIKSPIILLMGGTDRNHSFEGLKDKLSRVKIVLCYGETKNRIYDFVSKLGIPCEIYDNLTETTKRAFILAKKGDTILLSPACASWDQFNCFEERGNLFKKTIFELKNSFEPSNPSVKKFFLDKNKKIYMIGIGGISMSGIASILVSKGFTVSGSDNSNSSIIDILRNKNIKVHVPQNKENITDDIDFVVYTAAIKEDNPEYIAARKKGIPMMERGEFLGKITEMYSDTIGISGTHGKTTTTSMLSCIFLENNSDPSILVGSYLSNIDGNYRIGQSNTFIIEACEYCDSFLSFKQKSAIVLNIDNDHLDYFKNIYNIKKSFINYVSKLPRDGYLIINNDDENSRCLIKKTKANIVTYGINKNSNYMAVNINYDKLGYPMYTVLKNGEILGHIKLSVIGRHNILNSLSTIALADCYGISFSKIKSGLLKYKGASRRFEFKGKFKNATVIDDYGHHPTEINAVNSSLSNMDYNESWVIFEPHTYSRVYNNIDAFALSLSNFDHIIITDIFGAREQNIYNVHPNDIVKKLKQYNKESFYISSFEDITTYLSEFVNSNDIIITLGAGKITKLSDILVQKQKL